MKQKQRKGVRLDEAKDKYLSKIGTPKRDLYEYNLQLDLIGEMIKMARKERNLTQAELGQMIGVQKAQISKLENNASNVTIGTLVKVFKALETDIKLKMDFQEGKVEIIK